MYLKDKWKLLDEATKNLNDSQRYVFYEDLTIMLMAILARSPDGDTLLIEAVQNALHAATIEQLQERR